LQRILFVDPQLGRFAGRGIFANIDVVIAHDEFPC
jgi:hypothetical protein